MSVSWKVSKKSGQFVHGATVECRGVVIYLRVQNYLLAPEEWHYIVTAGRGYYRARLDHSCDNAEDGKQRALLSIDAVATEYLEDRAVRLAK